jgi:hypothetical protein
MVTIAEALLMCAVCFIFGAMIGMVLISAMVIAKNSDDCK